MFSQRQQFLRCIVSNFFRIINFWFELLLYISDLVTILLRFPFILLRKKNTFKSREWTPRMPFFFFLYIQGCRFFSSWIIFLVAQTSRLVEQWLIAQTSKASWAMAGWGARRKRRQVERRGVKRRHSGEGE